MPDLQAQYEHEIAATCIAMGSTAQLMGQLASNLDRAEDYFILAEQWDKLQAHLQEMRARRDALAKPEAKELAYRKAFPYAKAAGR